ncbi:MAG: hypothetical protein IT449_11915 [Phycisphaerales bacterium]|nr:hypothetical protein [Phycisphaerales bacterium]
MKLIHRAFAACLGVAVFAASGPRFSASGSSGPDGSGCPTLTLDASLGDEFPNQPHSTVEGEDGGSKPADSDPASHDSPGSPTPDSDRYLTVFHGSNAERSLKLGSKLRHVGLNGRMPSASQAVNGDVPDPVRVIPEGPLDRSVSPRKGPIQRHAPPRR